jgi:hypothetical protein
MESGEIEVEPARCRSPLARTRPLNASAKAHVSLVRVQRMISKPDSLALSLVKRAGAE